MSDFSINGPGGALPSAAAQPQAATKKGPGGFLKTLQDSIEKVDGELKQADQAISDLAVGRRKTLHETMIAVEKADISFRMLLAVRNKLISSYKEIMSMHF